MLKYNIYAMQKINEALMCSKSAVPQYLQVSPQAYNKWCKRGHIQLRKLVDICNTYQIPLCNFIVIDDTTSQGVDCIKSKWYPIEFHFDLFIGNLIKKNNMSTGGKYSPREQVKKLLGIGNARYKYFNDNDIDKILTLTVDDWLGFCNKAHLYPGDYIIDPNGEIPVDLDNNVEITERFTYIHRCQAYSNNQLAKEEEIRTLNSSNMEKDKRIGELSFENKRLKAEIEILRNENKRLIDSNRKLTIQLGKKSK